MCKFSSMPTVNVQQDSEPLEETVDHLKNDNRNELLRIISELTTENKTLRKSEERNIIEIYSLTGHVIKLAETNAMLVAENKVLKAEKLGLKRGAKKSEAEKQRFTKNAEELRNENKRIQTVNQQLKDRVASAIPSPAPAISKTVDVFAGGLAHVSNANETAEKENKKAKKEMIPASRDARKRPAALDGSAKGLVIKTNDDDEAKKEEKKKMAAEKRTNRLLNSLRIDMVSSHNQPINKRPRLANYKC